MTGSVQDVGRALLIGNSRWHWTQRQGNTVRIEHGPPDPGRIGTNPPVWAAVGPVPEPLMAHQDLRICLEDVPLPKACLLYTSPSPRDISGSRMPSSA